MSKLILIATIAMGTVLFAPQALTAQACVEGYERCLNDTHDTSGMTRILADIECYATYVGCVRALL